MYINECKVTINELVHQSVSTFPITLYSRTRRSSKRVEVKNYHFYVLSKTTCRSSETVGQETIKLLKWYIFRDNLYNVLYIRYF